MARRPARRTYDAQRTLDRDTSSNLPTECVKQHGGDSVDSASQLETLSLESKVVVVGCLNGLWKPLIGFT